VIAHVVPGDPAATWAGPHASAAQVAAARRYLGLDRPPAVQLLSYFGGVLTGNWGIAIHTHRPVLSDLAVVAPASLELVTAAMIMALVVAVPLGLISARWPGRARRPGDPGRLHPRGVDADLLAGAHPPAGLRPAAAPAAGGR
jgi:ABC-type dipeptide/oligopeptide/nickel transport systems, permease components